VYQVDVESTYCFGRLFRGGGNVFGGGPSLEGGVSATFALLLYFTRGGGGVGGGVSHQKNVLKFRGWVSVILLTAAPPEYKK
jgi:hypothetical protein